jgi:hypothetical protein
MRTCPRRSSLSASIISILAGAAAMIALLPGGILARLSNPCEPAFQDGCVESQEVPCNGGSCAATGQPVPDEGGEPRLERCTENPDDTAHRWSSVPVQSWAKCVDDPGSTGDHCMNQLTKCADVFLYRGSPCDSTSLCGSYVVRRCGAGPGPYVDCPDDPGNPGD